MKSISRTAYAVLGMISLGERSGYDLKKDFEQRVRPYWAESMGQIYPALRALEERGLIRSRDASGAGARTRRLHRITAKGRTELRAWLGETPAREQVRNEMLLKLFFGGEAGFAVSLAHVEAYEESLRHTAAVYAGFEEVIAAEEVSAATKVCWRLTLLSGQRVTATRIRWCRDAKRILREHLASQEATRASR